MKNISYKIHLNGTPVSYKLKDQANKSIKTVFIAKNFIRLLNLTPIPSKKVKVWQNGPSKESFVVFRWKDCPEKINSTNTAEYIENE